MKTVAISGAGGYIGSALAEFLSQQGYSVIPLSRNSGEGSGGISFRLEDASGPELREDIDVLIHCAWDLTQVGWTDIERVNVQGSMRLLEAARRANVKPFIFISSMAAYPGCQSMYGRAKLLVEAAVQEAGGIVIRPGTVWGDPLTGILGSVDGLIGKLPVIPLIGSGRQPLYCIHKDDLCAVVAACMDQPETRPVQPVSAAYPEAIPFREIVHCLARRKGRRVRLLPLPSTLIWGMLRLAELFSLPLGLRSDSVTSLNHLNPSPDFSAMDAMGIPLRHLLD